MVKTIDDITIINNDDSFIFTNNKNGAHVNLNAKDGSISFRDSLGNSMLNHAATIRINFEVFKLTAIGDTISCSDGTISAYLSSNDVQELAENSFYEEGQTRIFDFMKLAFTVAL
jgi:hypothetical protein